MIFQGGDSFGKVLILTFDATEECIVDKIITVLAGEKIVEQVTVSCKDEVSYKNFEINFKKRQVLRKGERIELTKIEFDVLTLLSLHPGTVFTKEQIFESAYSEDAIGYIDNSIYCLIRSLRKKLEPDPDNPKHIITVRGVGYRFEPD